MDPMIPTQYKIQRVKKETQDVFTVELIPAEGERKFSFGAGQFNMLYIFGTGEIPISISGNPNKTGVLIHTTRTVGMVTKAMSKLKAGDTIGVRGPYGSTWPVKEAIGNDIVIIAGGIGLAPLRTAIYEILRERESYGRIAILYGTRTPDDILFKRELEKLKSRLDLDVQVTVDRAARTWNGNVGVVTTLIPRVRFDPKNTTAMICGPEIMMKYSISELMKSGLSAEKIFLSMERNMKCGIGFCGHCQYGTEFICKDGPIFKYERIKHLFGKREI